MSGLSQHDYVERLYAGFLRKYNGGTVGAMFKIDDEEEKLQGLLDKLMSCADGVLNAAGMGRKMEVVQAEISRVKCIHDCLLDMQMVVLSEGCESLVLRHDQGSLIYQQD